MSVIQRCNVLHISEFFVFMIVQRAAPARNTFCRQLLRPQLMPTACWASLFGGRWLLLSRCDERRWCNSRLGSAAVAWQQGAQTGSPLPVCSQVRGRLCGSPSPRMNRAANSRSHSPAGQVLVMLVAGLLVLEPAARLAVGFCAAGSAASCVDGSLVRQSRTPSYGKRPDYRAELRPTACSGQYRCSAIIS